MMNSDTDLIQFSSMRVQDRAAKSGTHYLLIEPLMEFVTLDRKDVEQLRDTLNKWLDEHKPQHDHDFGDDGYCRICAAPLF
jgi:hypothetical protein